MAPGTDAVVLQWRPFAVALPRPLVTARGQLCERRGWLLRLRTVGGAVGWGEAAPLASAETLPAALQRTAAAIAALGASTAPLSRQALEAWMASPGCPAALAFGLGSALAEADGLVGPAAGGWRPAPPSAQLLPAGAAAPAALEAAIGAGHGATPLCFKWKVAVEADALERSLLEELLARLPVTARLRLDANGGWSRDTAAAWAERLAADPRLQWLEQPLAPADHPGLQALAMRVPVALDESLDADPRLRLQWPSWQVRRPSQEGDPRPLLAALRAGRPRLVLSTAFETGIGRRWLHHLAALQADGPTPAAPGLAPGWQPSGPLLAADPEGVWEAAACP